jgi:hypothetical protein
MQIDPLALRDGALQRLNLGLRGGAERFSYFLSGDQDNENGRLLQQLQPRRSGRGNFTLVAARRGGHRVNVSYAQNDLRLPPRTSRSRGAAELVALPAGAPRDPDGGHPDGHRRGPTRSSTRTSRRSGANNYNNRTQSDRVVLGATLNYNPASWLRNRFTIGTDQLYSTADVLVLPGDEFEPVGNVLQRTPAPAQLHGRLRRQPAVPDHGGLRGTTSVGTQVIARSTETLTATGQGLGAPDVTTIGSATVTTGAKHVLREQLRRLLRPAGARLARPPCS